ncbi:uncharacterized protein LOC129951743 [Eupeodes corollae]|uniref:uncharacterized protein LOC129951743 n=1 Tax=Eupeodes corollae TaxID=290404 RepID=UPI0024916163|nr:uncharacterized protein LOC129951743 [Eupeodes corollae]
MMSKSINSKQSDMLLNKMQENPEIARGFVKESKDKINAFWKRITLELNSAGPPIKTEFEWKKVWNDQKRYVRKKAATNKMYERGTGGGPNRTQKFSPGEEAIFQLVGMKEAVEGVGTSQSFGLKLPQKRKQGDEENQSPIQDLFETIVGYEDQNQQGCEAPPLPLSDTQIAPENSSDEATTTASTSRNARKQKVGKMSTLEVVMEELQTQKDLCGKLGEAISVMKDHNKNMEIGVKKLYRSLDSLNDKKKDQLKEEMRHNHEMENFRKMEIEELINKNRKMIELEELKIDILREDKKK